MQGFVEDCECLQHPVMKKKKKEASYNESKDEHEITLCSSQPG